MEKKLPQKLYPFSGVHYRDYLVPIGLHSIPIFLENPLRFPFLPYLSIMDHQFDAPYIRT